MRTLQKDFLIKIRNVYSFFTIYANIDGWSPTNPEHAGAPCRRAPNLLDRWLLSEVNLTTKSVRRALDRYMSYDAAHGLDRARRELVELVRAPQSLALLGAPAWNKTSATRTPRCTKRCPR